MNAFTRWRLGTLLFDVLRPFGDHGTLHVSVKPKGTHHLEVNVSLVRGRTDILYLIHRTVEVRSPVQMLAELTALDHERILFEAQRIGVAIESPDGTKAHTVTSWEDFLQVGARA